MKINRYKHECQDHYIVSRKDPIGDWVLYGDHKDIVEELEAALEQAVLRLIELGGDPDPDVHEQNSKQIKTLNMIREVLVDIE